MQRSPPLVSLLLKTAMFLPPCLGLWYWKAEWFTAIAALASGWLMREFFPVWVLSAEWSQRTLSIVTTLKIDTPGGVRDGHFASLVLDANPLVYCYGLPLFCALYLAGGAGRRWRRLLLGILFLLPFQIWGICFDLLKQAAITAGPGVAAQLGFEPWQRELIALSYQLGALIFPSLAPVVVWLALERHFIPLLMLEGLLTREEAKDANR